MVFFAQKRGAVGAPTTIFLIKLVAYIYDYYFRITKTAPARFFLTSAFLFIYMLI